MRRPVLSPVPGLARRGLAVALAAGLLVGCASLASRPSNLATPLAYEVHAPGGGRALLFGSVHVAREKAWQLPDSLTRELETAELLVLEIDMDATSSEELFQLMLGLGEMPPGQRLRQVVSDETWALLERRAPETGRTLEELDRLKPWVVALQFIGFSLQRAGFAQEHGVERELVSEAPRLPVRGLETPYDQLSMFDDLPYPVQDRMLLEALRPGGGPDAELDALMDAWRRGDARRLEALVFSDRDDPELALFYAETYDRRNLRMAEALEEILRETERAFVVVGAAHLVGERSLPRILHRSGFRVRQVSGTRSPAP